MMTRATAGFAAAMALGGIAQTRVQKPALAQGSPTRAGTFTVPEAGALHRGPSEFTAEFTFRAIAPHWRDGVAAVAVELVLSEDGVRWGPPVVVGPADTDAGPPDTDARVFGQLVMTDPVRHVRFRGLDANGNEIDVPGLAFTYIDASNGPALADLASPAIGGTLSRPPVITRNLWGASLAYGGNDDARWNWPAEYRTVQHIIIHHSETASFRDPLVEMRSIHYYHAVTRGWGDIGYNFLVDYLGNVYEGRWGGDNVVGGHAFQYAYGSSGICSMGQFSLESSTPEAIGALVWITAWTARNLDPLGRRDFHETPNLPIISGHRDVNQTSCPGDRLWADLPYIRSAVAQVIAGTRDSSPTVRYQPGEVVRTTVAGANLRRTPDVNGGIEQALDAGTTLTVIEGPTSNDGYTWYRVSGTSVAGWLATTVFAASGGAAPARAYREGDRVEVATDRLNIRSEPGLYGGIVATMVNGESAMVSAAPRTAGGITWLRIDSALGTGWVAAQYIAPAGRAVVNSAFVIGDLAAVDTDGLSLRADASTTARVLATLPRGAFATVIDAPRQSSGRVWLSVRTTVGSGWVAEEFMRKPSLELPPPTAPRGRFTIGDAIVVDTDALNLRSGPSTGNGLVGQLWTGTTGTVVDGPRSGSGYVWFRIRTASLTGWAVDDFLAPAGQAEAPAAGFEVGTTIAVTTDAVNLRASASTASGIAGRLARGATGRVVGNTRQADGYTWVQARFGGTTGWVATAFVGRAPAPTLDFGAITRSLNALPRARVLENGVNVRSAPTLGGRVLGQLGTGTSVLIADGPRRADGYTWFAVRAGGLAGWTVATFLLPDLGLGIQPGATVRVVDGEVNLRSEPSTRATVIRLLPDGATVQVVAGSQSADGQQWYRVTSSRYGTGWAVGTWLRRV